MKLKLIYKVHFSQRYMNIFTVPFRDTYFNANSSLSAINSSLSAIKAIDAY